MLNDIGTIVWKEFKEVIARSSQSRADTIKTIVVMAVILGILTWRASFLMTNLGALIVPSFVLVQLMAGIMADSFAGERERHTLETLLASRLSDSAILIGKITAGVLMAWGLMALTLGLGAATAFARNETSRMQVSFPHLVAILFIYLLLCIVVSCVASLVSLRAPTVRQAIQTLTWSFMIFFFAMIFLAARISPEWRAWLMRTLAGTNLVRTELIVIAVLLSLGAFFFSAARLRFQRARLILD